MPLPGSPSSTGVPRSPRSHRPFTTTPCVAPLNPLFAGAGCSPHGPRRRYASSSLPHGPRKTQRAQVLSQSAPFSRRSISRRQVCGTDTARREGEAFHTLSNSDAPPPHYLRLSQLHTVSSCQKINCGVTRCPLNKRPMNKKANQTAGPERITPSFRCSRSLFSVWALSCKLWERTGRF